MQKFTSKSEYTESFETIAQSVWCFVSFCYVSFCSFSLCFVTVRYIMLYCAAEFRFAMFCFVMFCYVSLCFFSFCIVSFYFPLLPFVTFYIVTFRLLCYVSFPMFPTQDSRGYECGGRLWQRLARQNQTAYRSPPPRIPRPSTPWARVEGSKKITRKRVAAGATAY